MRHAGNWILFLYLPVFLIVSKALPSEGRLSASPLLTFGKVRMKTEEAARAPH